MIEPPYPYYADPKVICVACEWRGRLAERLDARNPFDPGVACYGCPNCQAIDDFLLACDEDGCWKTASCETPAADGYRQTCRKHKPRRQGETMKIWVCKIGDADGTALPEGSDLPMRQAVEEEYRHLTGKEPDFCFSGWGGELNEVEQKVAAEK